MKLWERAFFINEPSDGVQSTYKQVETILSQCRGSGNYPRYRVGEAEKKYRQSFAAGSQQQLLDIRDQMNHKTAAILVNKIPYTAVCEVARGEILHSCLWWLRSEEPLSDERATNLAKELFGANVRAWFMENLTSNKSIKELAHAHLFVDVASVVLSDMMG